MPNVRYEERHYDIICHSERGSVISDCPVVIICHSERGSVISDCPVVIICHSERGSVISDCPVVIICHSERGSVISDCPVVICFYTATLMYELDIIIKLIHLPFVLCKLAVIPSPDPVVGVDVP